MIFNGRQTGFLNNFTMDVDPGYRYIKELIVGVQWSMMEDKDFISGTIY